MKNLSQKAGLFSTVMVMALAIGGRECRAEGTMVGGVAEMTAALMTGAARPPSERELLHERHSSLGTLRYERNLAAAQAEASGGWKEHYAEFNRGRIDVHGKSDFFEQEERRYAADEAQEKAKAARYQELYDESYQKYLKEVESDPRLKAKFAKTARIRAGMGVGAVVLAVDGARRFVQGFLSYEPTGIKVVSTNKGKQISDGMPVSGVTQTTASHAAKAQ